MVVLEYLMVYTVSGLPIYSKCYGSFCKAAFKNPELLSGFLSALETLPPTISADLSLDSVKMGPTEMRFSRTTPSGHTIVVGLGEDSADIAKKVFDFVERILAMEKFVSIDWTFISSDMMEAFEDELLKKTLVDALQDDGGFEDKCELGGDRCLIHTTAFQNTTRRGKIWGLIKDKYAAMRDKMSAA